MSPDRQRRRRGVLNERTGTVHRDEHDAEGLTAQCRALRHVSTEGLRSVPLDGAADEEGVERCGRCFEEVGGY